MLSKGFIFNKFPADVAAGRKGKNLLKKSLKLNMANKGIKSQNKKEKLR